VNLLKYITLNKEFEQNEIRNISEVKTMYSKETEYDTIVVGSGIGGLTAATRLAQNNQRILVIEANSDFGGYIRPINFGEYSFDMGLHYLGKLGQGELFREILDKLGLENLEFVELNPDSIDQYVFPDFTFNFCKGKDQLRERLIDNFPDEKEGIKHFIDLAVHIDVASAPNELAKGGIYSWVKYLLKHPLMIKYSKITYQTFLDKIFRDYRLKSVLSAPLFDVAAGPKQVSAATAMSLWGYYMSGAYYPRGGSRALCNAFVNGLRSSGARLIHSTPVAKIMKRNNVWVVRTEKGEEYTSRTVVSNADPKLTICSLMEKEILSPHVYKKANNLQPSGSIFSVFIGTDLDLTNMGFTTGNISQFANWDLTSYYDGWFGKTEPSVERAFFINSPSVRDPDGSLAPEGYSSLQILTGWCYEDFEKWSTLSVDQRGGEYKEYKEKITNRLVEKAERFVKDLSNHISFIKCITPLDCAEQVRSVRGAIYGPAHIPSQMGPGRFQNLTCGIEGSFLVGAGTFGCGLMYCSASGFYAAEAILSN
jgi:phytoene dehydrogenase-like protein